MVEFKSPPFWEQAKAELSAADPVMARIIASYHGEAMQGRDDAFHTLVRAIVGQQISVRAADAIFGRLEAGVGGITPENMAKFSAEEFRAFGLTRMKGLFAEDLTRYFIARRHLEQDWASMEDEAVLADLITIKGIGRWTAEMFLLFHLMRPDVLPLGDLGLVKAMWKFYNNGEKMPAADMLLLAEKWRPWRSVATWYLWRTYDLEAINY